MNSQEVLAQLIELVTPIAEERVAVINENTELAGELALDSLKVMDLMLAVEDWFDVSIPVNALAEVRTLGDLVAQIQKYAGQNP